MNELTLLGVSSLLILSTWRWGYRPAVLDETRDKLFDLRQKMRQKFIDEGHGLNHPLYAALRNLLNSHLRYTEDMRILEFIVMLVWMAKNKSAAEDHAKRFAIAFHTEDPELQRYAQTIRAHASMIMLEYAFKTSILMVGISWVLAPIVIARRVCRASKGLIAKVKERRSVPASFSKPSATPQVRRTVSWKMIKRMLKPLGAVFLISMTQATPAAARPLAQAVIEECAVHTCPAL